MSHEDTIGVQFDRSPLADQPLVARVLRPMPELTAPDLAPDVRAMACRAWEDRTRSEYVGVMIVRRFHGLLADLNAPMDQQELALALQLQEQQHANLCMVAARSLGSKGEVAFDTMELQQLRTDRPIQEQFIEMLIGTFVIGERVALALLSHAVKALPASPYRELLAEILRDEVLHARFGPVLLRQIREGTAPRWCPYPGDAWVKAFVEAHLEAMSKRAVVEPDEAEMFGDPEAGAGLEQVGIPNSRSFKGAYMDALERDAIDGLREAGITL